MLVSTEEGHLNETVTKCEGEEMGRIWESFLEQIIQAEF